MSGVWATNLHDDYGDDESGYLASPPISMVGCEGMTITLSVEHWYSTEIEMDGGNIQVSTDGGANWGVVHATGHPYDVSSVYSNLDPPKGQPAFVGSDEVWRTSTVDLSAHAGKPDVRVRFVFGSDGSIDRDGWYIDTVKVTAQ